MLDLKAVFTEIEHRFLANFPEVAAGNMMQAPALKVNGKVFCFFHEQKMGFKLGKGVDLDRPELQEAEFLNPFKNKAPMKAWLLLPFVTLEMWEALAEEALEKVSSQ